jgi:hypothetical protein
MCDWSTLETMRPLLVVSIRVVQSRAAGPGVTRTLCAFLGKALRSSINVGAAAGWNIDQASSFIQ